MSDMRANLPFTEAALVPIDPAAAKLMDSSLTDEESATPAIVANVPTDIMSSGRWTEEQLKLAFHLYCQLPFGKLHSRNPEVIALATLIGRTPSAVAMKLVNFASLDPAITSTGRNGLGNASALDREIWDAFHADWEGLALACYALHAKLSPDAVLPESDKTFALDDYVGETRRVVMQQRVKQAFFRRAVLASYRGRCCMSQLADARLLVASHIVPWCDDKANRLNPSNGLCLSAIHDKAFDKGLISLTDDLQILVSAQVKRAGDPFLNQVVVPLAGRQIELPERFAPTPAFIRYHRESIFVDSVGA